MSDLAVHLPHWSTASFASASVVLPSHFEQLGSHFSVCNGLRSRWFRLECVGESIRDFVASRLITTLCVATAVIALISVVG